MAQAKKDGGKTSAKKQGDGAGSAKQKASEETSAEKAVAASESSDDAAHGDDHGKPATVSHGAAAHHAPNRKEYLYIFLVLTVLTLIEVGVAQVPGISKTLLGIALVGLAVSKAAIVGLYYMHLKHETRILRLTVAIPMASPAVYAVVLIAEGAWRLAR